MENVASLKRFFSLLRASLTFSAFMTFLGFFSLTPTSLTSIAPALPCLTYLIICFSHLRGLAHPAFSALSRLAHLPAHLHLRSYRLIILFVYKCGSISCSLVLYKNILFFKKS